MPYSVSIPQTLGSAMAEPYPARAATDPQVTMRHQWRLGDVVLWNNFTTMHRRDAFPPDQVRTLHRSQIKGKYVPTAAAQKEAA